jgi:hypothetical protein
VKFQLYAEVTSEELFRKATSELGTVFYRLIDEKRGAYEIVYFSGSRVVRFVGVPSEELVKLCEANGFEVSQIEFDPLTGIVKVSQTLGE